MEEKMNNIVLIPTDFSEVASNAIKQAVKVAKFLKFKVYILNVIDKNAKAYLKKESLAASSIDEKLNKIASEIVKESNIEVVTESREGSIFTTISDVAKEIGANLIFLGTHGKVGVQKITGSLALKVITSSHVPVIVVQKRVFENVYNDIVLPITSDVGPWEKTKWATYIANEFNATIHIFQLPGKKIDDAVKQITGHFEKNKVVFTIKIADKTTNFSKQVIDYSTSINTDLIMIMTNLDKALTKFILGTYDEQIIFNTSQIPTLCINPIKFNWEKIVAQ